MEKETHQNKPLHIRNNPQGKPALEIILPYNYPVYNLLCIFFSQKNADLETKPEKDARKPWQGSDHGLLRNGRGGREMCLQLGLPRAGPITSVRSQAEEISRVNLSCGPKWIKGNLGWSHYKEINPASHLPLSCYPS